MKNNLEAARTLVARYSALLRVEELALREMREEVVCLKAQLEKQAEKEAKAAEGVEKAPAAEPAAAPAAQKVTQTRVTHPAAASEK